jgi:hypothetical protein
VFNLGKAPPPRAEAVFFAPPSDVYKYPPFLRIRYQALGLAPACYAPKGLEDSAQGFNPGKYSITRFALKGRELMWFISFYASVSPRLIWRPFRAHRLGGGFPGFTWVSQKNVLALKGQDLQMCTLSGWERFLSVPNYRTAPSASPTRRTGCFSSNAHSCAL